MPTIPSPSTHYVRTALDTVTGYTRYVKCILRDLGMRNPARRANTRHLLLLAWFFPPTISGGVYRPLSFARRAAELGWQVTVIAGPAPQQASSAGEHLLRGLPSSVRVLRISESELKPSYRLFPQIDGGFGNVIETLEQIDTSDIKPPSVILASGPPFHNFVAGWHLSRRFNAPLVLDYRDEWTQCPFEFVRLGTADSGWELKCLEHAASIVFTTRSFMRQAQIAFPSTDQKKFIHIPNGFEPGDLPPETEVSPPATQSNILQLAFLGALGPHTPADGFLNTVKELLESEPDWRTRLCIQFVGQRHRSVEPALSDSSLGDIISLRDQVSKPSAIRIMHESSALIAFNPPALERYIPGKLFDYIASGRPILVYGEGGEVASIVKELDAGIVVPENDVARLHDALMQLVAKGVADTDGKREQWLRHHERAALADQLLQHIETLLPDESTQK